MSDTPASELDASQTLWHGGTILPVHSVFSIEVFKAIRPVVPRPAWPAGQLTALFIPRADGMALIAEFEELTGEAHARAEARIIEKGVELVMMCPAARLAVEVFKAKKWRDTFLYGLVPLLFAIPFSAGLQPELMTVFAGLTLADLAALLVAQLRLSAAGSAVQAARFIAQLPVPGLHIRLDEPAPPVPPLSLE